MIFSDAGNTQNPALLVLAKMGYVVRAVCDPDEDSDVVWIALRGGDRLEASSPVELLGSALLVQE